MHLVPLICLGLGVLAVDCAAAQVCGIARENVPNKALIYPEESLRLGEQGTTVLNARISDLGYVETVDVKESSGYPRLDQVAVDTVKDWCFTPANKEGKNVSASVVIPLKFSLTSSPPLPTTEPLATPVRQPVETNTIVSSFVAQKDGFLAPQQVYGLTVELFARSYFFDLMSARKMGVDHPGWARKFPEFLDDMLVLLRPKNISLESYLERELLAQMEKNDLVNLISATKQPRYLGAVECLKGMGVSWEYLIQANSILQAPTLYSSEEKRRTKRISLALLGRLPEEEKGLVVDLLPIVDLIKSNEFKKYQEALSRSFFAGASRLEKSEDGKRDFQSFIARWSIKLDQLQ